MKFEQRKNDRVTLAIPVTYKVYRVDNLEQEVKDERLGLVAEIQDLSLGGIQLASEKPFKPGDVMEFEANIPGEGFVRTVAKVVWCRANKSKSFEKFNSGIEFIPVCESDLDKIKKYFRAGE